MILNGSTRNAFFPQRELAPEEPDCRLPQRVAPPGMRVDASLMD
jgi:hypothetical protein